MDKNINVSLFQVETVLCHPPLLLPRQKQGELQPYWFGFLPRQDTRLSASALSLPSWWRGGGGGRTAWCCDILCHVCPAPPHSGLYQHQHRRSTRIRCRLSVPTRTTTHKLRTVQLARFAQSWSLRHFVPFIGWIDAPFPFLSGLKLPMSACHSDTRITFHFTPSSHPPCFLTLLLTGTKKLKGYNVWVCRLFLKQHHRSWKKKDYI